ERAETSLGLEEGVYARGPAHARDGTRRARRRHVASSARRHWHPTPLRGRQLGRSQPRVSSACAMTRPIPCNQRTWRRARTFTTTPARRSSARCLVDLASATCAAETFLAGSGLVGREWPPVPLSRGSRCPSSLVRRTRVRGVLFRSSASIERVHSHLFRWASPCPERGMAMARLRRARRELVGAAPLILLLLVVFGAPALRAAEIASD